MLFPQPTEKTVDEPMEAVDAPCPRCGEAAVHRYRAVDYRGWLRVTKCRACLHLLESEKIKPPAQDTSPAASASSSEASA
jgi:predicted RNA-binding Zn-ribbon protein involved in translation (DUF1610 family)